jgi:hypothetical protein
MTIIGAIGIVLMEKYSGDGTYTSFIDCLFLAGSAVRNDVPLQVIHIIFQIVSNQIGVYFFIVYH